MAEDEQRKFWDQKNIWPWWKMLREDLSDDDLITHFDEYVETISETQDVFDIEIAKLIREELRSRVTERAIQAALKEARAARWLAITNTVFAALAVVVAVLALIVR